MARQTVINAGWSAALTIVVWVNPIRVEAQVLNELIGGAKKESEIAFTAGPSTFGAGKPSRSSRPLSTKSSD